MVEGRFDACKDLEDLAEALSVAELKSRDMVCQTYGDRVRVMREAVQVAVGRFVRRRAGAANDAELWTP